MESSEMPLLWFEVTILGFDDKRKVLFTWHFLVTVFFFLFPCAKTFKHHKHHKVACNLGRGSNQVIESKQ